MPRALNRAGNACRELGIRLCSHHHAHELENEARVLRAILDDTDPRRSIVLDVGNPFPPDFTPREDRAPLCGSYPGVPPARLDRRKRSSIRRRRIRFRRAGPRAGRDRLGRMADRRSQPQSANPQPQNGGNSARFRSKADENMTIVMGRKRYSPAGQRQSQLSKIIITASESLGSALNSRPRSSFRRPRMPQ